MLRDHVLVRGGTAAAFDDALRHATPRERVAYTRLAVANEANEAVVRRLLRLALTCGALDNVPLMAELLRRAEPVPDPDLIVAALNWDAWVRTLLAARADAALLYLVKRYMGPLAARPWRYGVTLRTVHGEHMLHDAHQRLLRTYAARPACAHATRMLSALLRVDLGRHCCAEVWLAALLHDRAHVLRRLVRLVAKRGMHYDSLYSVLHRCWRALFALHSVLPAPRPPLDALRYLLVDSAAHDNGKTRVAAYTAFGALASRLEFVHSHGLVQLYSALRVALPRDALPRVLFNTRGDLMVVLTQKSEPLLRAYAAWMDGEPLCHVTRDELRHGTDDATWRVYVQLAAAAAPPSPPP